MSYFTGTLLASPVVNGSSGDTYGTHFSVLGIGGYVEVNTINDRNNIPVNAVNGLDFDGLSSGRRKYGMLVNVVSLNKIYKLSPSYSSWLTFNNSQKVAALNDNNNWVEFSTLNAERISKIYTQALHGFAVGSVIGYNKSLNQFVKVTSSKSNTIEPLGVINSVISTSSFELTFAGYITPISGITDSSSVSLSGGTVYYLSDSITGKLTKTKPISSNSLVKPMLVTLTNNDAIVLQYQSNETSLYTAGQGINSNDLLNNRKISVDLSSFTQPFGGINITLTGSSNNAIYNDNTGNGYGIQYGANYSPTFLPSSLVDKRYVDAVALGLFPKKAALAATTINIDLTGGTFTGIIDGITIPNKARILVHNQTNEKQNGVYDYVLSAHTFTRSSDFNNSVSGQTKSGTLVPVVSGNTLFNTIWIVTTENPINIGTTPIEFTLFSRVNTYIPGVGIIISANTIIFDGANIAGNSMTWTGNKLNVDPTSGTLASALFNKLSTLVYNTYTGNTLNTLNYHQHEILVLSGKTFTVTGTTIGNTITGSKIYKTTSGNTNMLFRALVPSGGTKIKTSGDNIIIFSPTTFTGSSNNSVSAQNISKSFNQLLHGFGVNDVVAFSGTTFIRAIADGTMDGEILGVVTKVPDGDNFTITFAGYISGLTGLVTNSTYFLSDITPGVLSLVEPTAFTHLSKPVLQALSPTEAVIFNYRADIISSGTTSGGGSSINIIISKNPIYNATSGNYYIGCSGTTTVNLPATPLSGNEYTISDLKGNALTNNITINGNGFNINTGAFALINTNNGSITVLFNGVIWNVIGFVS